MLNKELESALGGALSDARRRRHEYLATEHVLLALLDQPYGREVLEGCGADLDNRRKKLDDYLTRKVEAAPAGTTVTVQQTHAFERLMQRAGAHLRRSATAAE